MKFNEGYKLKCSVIDWLPVYSVIEIETNKYLGYVPQHCHLEETPAKLHDGTILPGRCMSLGDSIRYIIENSSRDNAPSMIESDLYF